MIIRTTISPKLQSLVRRVVQSHGNSLRPMTVLSKQSAEEYKKQVRPELVCVCVCVCVFVQIAEIDTQWYTEPVDCL
jgi:hypothetical protein